SANSLQAMGRTASRVAAMRAGVGAPACFQAAAAPMPRKGRAANSPKGTNSRGSAALATTTSPPAIAMLAHHGERSRIANREFLGSFSFTKASGGSYGEPGSIEGPAGLAAGAEGGAWGSARGARAGQELQQQAVHPIGLLLLDPVAGALDEVAGLHPGAGPGLHGFVGARSLVYAPVAAAGKEAGRHLDPAAGEQLETGRDALVGGAAIPLQPALETG